MSVLSWAGREAWPEEQGALYATFGHKQIAVLNTAAPGAAAGVLVERWPVHA
jgi:hypothetical protein